MKRSLILAATVLALVLLVRGPLERKEKTVDNSKAPEIVEENLESAPLAGTPEEANQKGDFQPQAERERDAVFFPRAKILARVSEPEDAEGQLRVIETLESPLHPSLVRVERVLQRQGGSESFQLQREVAMVANQLMLQRPEAQGKEEFLHSVRRAGAIEIKELADDIFLATFTAEPENPRALDAYVSRLREVAGAEISVEPNYIRKVF